MLLKNEIIIKTNPSNYKHYINKGYLIDKCGMEILIKINDLPIKSHVKVDCVCTNCKNITKIEFFNYIRQIKDSYYVCKNCWKFKLRNTMIKKYGVSNAREINDVNDKIFKTNMSRYGVGTPLKVEKYREMIFEYYGVKNISQLDRIKEIKKLKSVKKYGSNSPLQFQGIIDIIRQKHIDSGRWKEYDKNKYSDYRKKVNYLTKKNKNVLFENWNGYDYYDNEYIFNNLKIDKNHNHYPSIDHKVSVLFGFLNNIDPKDISNIDNLCITKRWINSSKYSLNEKDFVI